MENNKKKTSLSKAKGKNSQSQDQQPPQQQPQSGMVTKKGVPASHCKEKTDKKEGGDDKENGGGVTNAHKVGGDSKKKKKKPTATTKRPVRIQRQPRERNLKRILQEKLPEFNLLRNATKGKSTAITKRNSRQGYRNESFYAGHQTIDTNKHNTHNIENNTHNNRHTILNEDKENRENYNVGEVEAPEVKKGVKRAMPLLGGRDELMTMFAVAADPSAEPMTDRNRERMSEEEIARREMAKRQASLVMQKRGTLRALKQPPINSSSSFYNNHAITTAYSTVRR